MKNLTVSLIGAGNLAWHLGPALDNAGIVVKEVHARNKADAIQLITRLYQAKYHPSLDFSESKSNLFILAVSDEAIEEVAREIELPQGAIIVHTSASQSAGILAHSGSESYGVLYPLQTFTKGKRVDFKDIPVLVESMDASTLQVLKQVAGALTKHVYVTDGKTRRAVHMAAVFASNFTNHMYKIAADICDAHGMDFDILYPLIRETQEKALSIGPENAQTGPARRRDFAVLDKHLGLLNKNPELSEIYRMISQHIVDTYSEEEE